MPPVYHLEELFLGSLLFFLFSFTRFGKSDSRRTVCQYVGNISKAVGAERTIVFFDDTLDLPTLNVVLVRQSWDEITPSTTAWP
jgi:hypothetical protein